MTRSLNCPNCYAPLDITDRTKKTVACPYCHIMLDITDELLIEPSRGTQVTDMLDNKNPLIDLNKKEQFFQEMVKSGNMQVAVKALQDVFNIDKSEAKSLVDAMARGEDLDTSLLPLRTYATKVSPSLDPVVVQHLSDLIRSGEKIEAIKLLRQQTGLGLKDARDAIDGMESAILASPVDSYSDTSQALPAMEKKVNRSNRWIMPGFFLFIFLVVILPILAGMASNGGPLAGVWARINPFAVGRVTLAFGKEGTGPGYFDGAGIIAVDNNGHIFIGEYSGGRVQVFDHEGKFLTQWTASGEEMGDVYLSGMAAGRDGALYTVVNSQLYVYDGLNGNLLGKLEHPDGWGFDDVSLAPNGSVVAAWYKNRDDLLRFDATGDITLIVKGAIENVTGDGEMNARVAVDGEGHIYDLAYFNQAVFVFSADGRYISRFGSMGDERGQFTSPRSIAVDIHGKIYIADFPGVMIYENDGRYLDTLPVNGAVMGMVFDDQNNLYLIADAQVLRIKLK